MVRKMKNTPAGVKQHILKVLAGASNSWSGRLQLSVAENHNNFLGFSSREAPAPHFLGCPTGHSPGLFGRASCSKGEFVPLGTSPLGLSPSSGRDLDRQTALCNRVGVALQISDGNEATRTNQLGDVCQVASDSD